MKLAPNDPEARYKLVLEIQQQLRRVGCYWGRTDGSWGVGTKDALKEFTDRVNATLPLDEPDYVQLTLIQSHGEKVVRRRARRAIAFASGRCVGLPITAQAKPPSTQQVASTQQKEVLPWRATSAARRLRADSRCSSRWRPRSSRASRCRAAWRSAARSRRTVDAQSAPACHDGRGDRADRHGDCRARSDAAARRSRYGTDVTSRAPFERQSRLLTARGPGHTALQSAAEPRRRLLSRVPRRAPASLRRRLLHEPAEIIGRAAFHRNDEERRVGVGMALPRSGDRGFR